LLVTQLIPVDISEAMMIVRETAKRSMLYRAGASQLLILLTPIILVELVTLPGSRCVRMLASKMIDVH
jgi:hypothetical protein